MRDLTRGTGRGMPRYIIYDYLSRYGTGSQSCRSRTELASPLDTPVLRYTECSEEETLAAKREGKNIPRNMYKTRLLLGTRILLQ